MNKESLGDRMKRYEESTNFKIIPRAPIMVRIDGKAFSTLTKRLKLAKPYDICFSSWMTETAKRVASEMQGCMLAYTQSDEITFAIRSDQTEETTPWFDNRVQKIVSVAASVAAATFNHFIPVLKDENGEVILDDFSKPKRAGVAFFDCRVWPMPSMMEVVNNLIWRQRDCVKNSISSACYYEVGRIVGKGTARKMMHKKNQDQQQELLFSEAGVNWNNYPAEFKRGIVAYRNWITVTTENGTAERRRWEDSAAPIFTSEYGRDWLSQILMPECKDEERQEVRQDQSPKATE